MKIELDTHVHSIASGHAFNTVKELCEYSCMHGLQLICITDHGPVMQGTAHEGYFTMGESLPFNIGETRVLFGCECNVKNGLGELDLSDDILKNLDVVLVGLHEKTPFDKAKGTDYNTKALQLAMCNPMVDIVAHPYRKEFPTDIKRIVETAKMTNCLLELNSRVIMQDKNELNIAHRNMLEYCSEMNVKVVIASDAHSIYDLEKSRLFWMSNSTYDEFENIFVHTPEELLDILNSKRTRKKTITRL